MEKILYENKGHTVGRYRCVSIDAQDKLLVSTRGWIFLAGDRLGVVYCHNASNEEISYYNINQLEAQLERIGGFIPTDRQAILANNPNKRYE